ncbi:CoA ester lyase [Chelativorans composti]
MDNRMKEQSMSLRRSVLYMPASNERALAKSPSLACDSIIFDFEDAVGPDEKAAARERLLAFLSGAGRPQRELVIRINALDSEWGRDDLAAACACRPDAILIPKVEGVETLREVDRALAELNAPADLKLWAMMETPRSILNAGTIADYARDPSSRLDCLVVGPNDLARATCMVPGPDRANLLPLLLQVVLCARAGGITALDGVSNNFRDLEAFASECRQGRELGFDGKTLIHPAQIDGANRIFGPTDEEVAEAEAIVAEFAEPENSTRGVISMGGKMVERLHLEMARSLLEKARLIRERTQ